MQSDNTAFPRPIQGGFALQQFGTDSPIETVEVPDLCRRRLDSLRRSARVSVHRVFPCGCGRPVALVRLPGSGRVRLVDAIEETVLPGFWTAALFGSHDC